MVVQKSSLSPCLPAALPVRSHRLGRRFGDVGLNAPVVC